MSRSRRYPARRCTWRGQASVNPRITPNYNKDCFGMFFLLSFCAFILPYFVRVRVALLAFGHRVPANELSIEEGCVVERVSGCTTCSNYFSNLLNRI